MKDVVSEAYLVKILNKLQLTHLFAIAMWILLLCVPLDPKDLVSKISTLYKRSTSIYFKLKT